MFLLASAIHHRHMKTKGSLVIAVAVLIVFSYLAYSTIEKSTSNVSGSTTVTEGYLSVVNDTQKLYFVSNETTYVQFNMTVYTSAPSVYIYDISPLNNTSAVWVNLTSLGAKNYEQVDVQNGSVVSVNLSLNSTAVGEMKPFNPITMSGVYSVAIIVISSNDGVAAFGFGVGKLG